MRFNFGIYFEISRSPREQQEPAHYDLSGSQVEQADRPPVGFQRNPESEQEEGGMCV